MPCIAAAGRCCLTILGSTGSPGLQPIRCTRVYAGLCCISGPCSTTTRPLLTSIALVRPLTATLLDQTCALLLPARLHLQPRQLMTLLLEGPRTAVRDPSNSSLAIPAGMSTPNADPVQATRLPGVHWSSAARGKRPAANGYENAAAAWHCARPSTGSPCRCERASG